MAEFHEDPVTRDQRYKLQNLRARAEGKPDSPAKRAFLKEIDDELAKIPPPSVPGPKSQTPDKLDPGVLPGPEPTRRATPLDAAGLGIRPGDLRPGQTGFTPGTQPLSAAQKKRIATAEGDASGFMPKPTFMGQVGAAVNPMNVVRAAANPDEWIANVGSAYDAAALGIPGKLAEGYAEIGSLISPSTFPGGGEGYRNRVELAKRRSEGGGLPGHMLGAGADALAGPSSVYSRAIGGLPKGVQAAIPATRALAGHAGPEGLLPMLQTRVPAVASPAAQLLAQPFASGLETGATTLTQEVARGAPLSEAGRAAWESMPPAAAAGFGMQLPMTAGAAAGRIRAGSPDIQALEKGGATIVPVPGKVALNAPSQRFGVNPDDLGRGRAAAQVGRDITGDLGRQERYVKRRTVAEVKAAMEEEGDIAVDVTPLRDRVATELDDPGNAVAGVDSHLGKLLGIVEGRLPVTDLVTVEDLSPPPPGSTKPVRLSTHQEPPPYIESKVIEKGKQYDLLMPEGEETVQAVPMARPAIDENGQVRYYMTVRDLNSVRQGLDRAGSRVLQETYGGNRANKKDVVQFGLANYIRHNLIRTQAPQLAKANRRSYSDKSKIEWARRQMPSEGKDPEALATEIGALGKNERGGIIEPRYKRLQRHYPDVSTSGRRRGVPAESPAGPDEPGPVPKEVSEADILEVTDAETGALQAPPPVNRQPFLTREAIAERLSRPQQLMAEQNLGMKASIPLGAGGLGYAGASLVPGLDGSAAATAAGALSLLSLASQPNFMARVPYPVLKAMGVDPSLGPLPELGSSIYPTAYPVLDFTSSERARHMEDRRRRRRKEKR